MNRRESLQLLAASAAVTTASALAGNAAFAQAMGQQMSQQMGQAQPAASTAGPFKLPPLGYAYDALEPHVDAMTMTIHHTRHHQAFVTNLNQLVEKWPELGTMTPEAILSDLSKVPEALRTPVRNNLGGHWNHSFFWDLMTPGGAKEPNGDPGPAAARRRARGDRCRRVGARLLPQVSEPPRRLSQGLVEHGELGQGD